MRLRESLLLYSLFLCSFLGVGWSTYQYGYVRGHEARALVRSTEYAQAEFQPPRPGDVAATMARAEAIREARDRACLSAEDVPSAVILAQPWAQEARRQNLVETRQHYVQTAEVVAFSIQHTLETAQWVVTIYDPDQRRTSFWGEGGSQGQAIPVRSISPY